MEKIDFKKVKELGEGKQPSKEDFKSRATIKIKPPDANELNVNEAKKKAKELIERSKESWLQKLDRENKRFADMQSRPAIRGIDPDPGLETKTYLFMYQSKYYFIEGKSMQKIAEADVQPTLDKNPEIEIYYICSDRLCEIPDALQGKVKTAKRVKDSEAAIQFINEKTNNQFSVKNL
jgi:hypothetical protein